MKEEKMLLIMKHIVGFNIAWQRKYLTDKTGFLFCGTHCICWKKFTRWFSTECNGEWLCVEFIQIVGCPAERRECMCRFAENLSFYQAHAFEVLTPTPTYRQFIICTFYLSKFHNQARFCLQISYPTILFTMLMGFLNGGSFIIHVLLPGTRKVFTLSGFLPGTCAHVLQPGTQRNASEQSCLIPFTHQVSLTLLYTSSYYFLLLGS